MRSAGEGSIYRRGDGKWTSAMTWTDVDGKRQRKVFYGKTRTEARAKLVEAQTRVRSGAPPVDSSQTVGEWVTGWCKALDNSQRKASTIATYRGLMKTHVHGTALASTPLAKVKPSTLDTWTAGLSKTLSPSSVAKVQTTLSIAFKAAVRDELIAVNPFTKVTMVRRTKPEIVTLTREQLHAVLRQLRGTRCEGALSFIAALGLRKGEALALQWSDVDLQARTVTVRATLARVDGIVTRTPPKTAKARRTLPLSDHALSILRTQPPRGPYVFSTESGQPLDPRNVLRDMQRAATRAGVPGATVHTLRHTATTLLLEAGVHLRAVADLMGHADIRMTAEVYASLSTHQARSAMDALGALQVAVEA